MSSPLPDYADPWVLCDQNRGYRGRVELKRMTRLAPLLATTNGEAAFVLAFSRDQKRRALVSGEVQATLQLPCQRCLEPVDIVVDSTFEFAFVGGELEAEQTPDELTPMIVEDNEVILLELLEDELMLALPAAPKHDVADCAVDLAAINQLPADFQAEESKVEEDNPFAMLSGLKNGDKEH